MSANNWHIFSIYSNLGSDNNLIYLYWLPQAFAQARAEQCLRIPQSEHIRSLNFSNAAAIVLYEALRQQSFPSLA